MGAVWPSSLCHCRHKGACPLAAGSPNGCVLKAENKHRASETGQNQAVSESSSRGAKPSTSLQQPQPGTVAGLGKVAEGREEQSCSCCSLQLSNKLHILETSVRMTGTEKKKKPSRNGQFSKGKSHCNYTSCENIIPSRLSSAVLYFLRINLQRALACLSSLCSGATRYAGNCLPHRVT